MRNLQDEHPQQGSDLKLKADLKRAAAFDKPA